MTVTAMNANHCPGSLMFLFEGYFGRILYTGDFRYQNSLLTNTSLITRPVVDRLYLDNTYCHPNCLFQTRERAAKEIIRLIEKYPDHHILLSVHSLGKEELLRQLATHFKTQVILDREKLQQLKLIHADNLFSTDLFSTDPEISRIEAVLSTLVMARRRQLVKQGADVLVIMPTALGMIMPHEQRFSSHKNVHIVEYSDHSSYRELRKFVSEVQPKLVIPIVKGKLKDTIKNVALNTTDMSHFNDLLDCGPVLEYTIPTSVRQYSMQSLPLHMKSTGNAIKLRKPMFTPKKRKRKATTEIMYLTPKSGRGIPSKGSQCSSPSKLPVSRKGLNIAVETCSRVDEIAVTAHDNVVQTAPKKDGKKQRFNFKKLHGMSTRLTGVSQPVSTANPVEGARIEAKGEMCSSFINIKQEYPDDRSAFVQKNIPWHPAASHNPAANIIDWLSSCQTAIKTEEEQTEFYLENRPRSTETSADSGCPGNNSPTHSAHHPQNYTPVATMTNTIPLASSTSADAPAAPAPRVDVLHIPQVPSRSDSTDSLIGKQPLKRKRMDSDDILLCGEPCPTNLKNVQTRGDNDRTRKESLDDAVDTAGFLPVITDVSGGCNMYWSTAEEDEANNNVTGKFDVGTETMQTICSNPPDNGGDQCEKSPDSDPDQCEFTTQNMCVIPEDQCKGTDAECKSNKAMSSSSSRQNQKAVSTYMKSKQSFGFERQSCVSDAHESAAHSETEKQLTVPMTWPGHSKITKKRMRQRMNNAVYSSVDDNMSASDIFYTSPEHRNVSHEMFGQSKRGNKLQPINQCSPTDSDCEESPHFEVTSYDSDQTIDYVDTVNSGTNTKSVFGHVQHMDVAELDDLILDDIQYRLKCRHLWSVQQKPWCLLSNTVT